jgi:deoxyribodipyrimidine photo-lyase
MHGPGAGRSTVVLFTRDLRVADHAGLGEAVRTSEHVVPLFVLDDTLLRRTNGANRLAFLLDALADLRSSLRGLGADLVLRRGDPVVETLRVAEAAGASTVVVGDDAGPYARARQERLVRECRRARLDLRVAETTSVIAPGVSRRPTVTTTASSRRTGAAGSRRPGGRSSRHRRACGYRRGSRRASSRPWAS